MLLRGFIADGGSGGITRIDATGFSEVFGAARTWKIIGQTLSMALGATCLSLVLGIAGAFVLYKLRFRGQGVLRAIVMVPFALPTVVVGVAFRSLFATRGIFGFLGLDQTTTAVVLAMTFFNYGLVVRTVGTLWASLDPHDEAARTLGASPWRAFRTVTLPQLGPGIAAAAGLVFLFCSTSFGIVQTLGRPGYGTVESEIYVQTTTFFDLRTAAVLSVIQFLIVIAALLGSHALTRRTETVLQMRRSAQRAARLSDAPLMIASFAVIALLLVAPMASLLLGSLRSQGKWTVHNYTVLGTSGAGFSGGVSVLEAIDHSIRIALDASLIALIIGILLAFILSRRVGGILAKAQQILDGFILLPLGVSAVTVGFGFLITWGRVSWLDSALIVPVAQSVVALPLVIRSLVPVLRGIDPMLRQAAATLGASPARIVWTIDVPFMVRGIGLAYGFAFAISLGEFGATSFLANPDYQTLPVLIARLLSRPGVDNYGMALAGAVILAVLTGVAMITAELFKPRNSAHQAL